MNRREFLIKTVIAAANVKVLPLAAEKGPTRLPSVSSSQRWVELAETLKLKLHEVVRPIVEVVMPCSRQATA